MESMNMTTKNAHRCGEIALIGLHLSHIAKQLSEAESALSDVYGRQKKKDKNEFNRNGGM
jgi:hypothetical protein